MEWAAESATADGGFSGFRLTTEGIIDYLLLSTTDYRLLRKLPFKTTLLSPRNPLSLRPQICFSADSFPGKSGGCPLGATNY
jgi:hypothetical protein